MPATNSSSRKRIPTPHTTMWDADDMLPSDLEPSRALRNVTHKPHDREATQEDAEWFRTHRLKVTVYNSVNT